MPARRFLGAFLDSARAPRPVALVVIAAIFAILGVPRASAQDFGFQASNRNTAGIGNKGVMGVTGAGSNGFLNTAANQAAGIQANGLKTEHVTDVGVGDFNGDGIDDLAFVSADDTLGTGLPNTQTLTILLGLGDGTFGPPQTYTLVDTKGTPILSAVPHSLAAADVDLDGISDIAIAECVTETTGLSFSRVLLVKGEDLLNAQPGSMVSAVNFNTDVALPGITGTPAAVALGRLQNGPIPGIAVAVAGTPGLVLAILPDPVTGSFTSPGVKIELFRTTGAINDPLLTGIHTPRDITIGKSNFSTSVATSPPGGDLDIMVATSAGIEIVENNAIQAPATFTRTNVLATANQPDVLAVADFNNDGFPDIVVSNRGSGTVSAFLAQAPAGFGYLPRIDTFVGANPVSLAPMDFNNDGNEDIVVAEGSSGPGVPGQVAAFTGNGLGSFTFAKILLIGNVAPNFVSVVSRRLDLNSPTDDIVVAELGTPPGSTPPDPGGAIFLDALSSYNPIGIPTGAPTNTFVTPNPPNPNACQAIQLIALVQASLGTVTVSGTARSIIDGNLAGFGLLNSSGFLLTTSPPLAPGTHKIVGEFVNNPPLWAGSTSAVDNLIVAPCGPTITSFTPPSGPTGTVVTINGSGFTGTTSVSFGGTLATTFTVVSDTQITAVVPVGAVTGQIIVATPNGTATSLTNFTVNKGNTTTTVTSSANPSVVGQSVTYTAKVAAVPPASGTPTGTVNFTVGAFPPVPVTLMGGVATFTFTLNHTVNITIRADYVGDQNFNGSSGSLSQVSDAADTTTTLTSSANSLVFGQGLTFTANVSAVSPGSGTPTGTVTFRNGTTVLGSVLLGVPFVVRALVVGTDTITATYSGDANFNGSTSAAITVNVSKANTNTSISCAPNPANTTQAVVCTATVGPQLPSLAIPQGPVDFTVDGSPLPSVLLDLSGQATITVPPLLLGPHAFDANYMGNSNFNGSAGSTTVNVNCPPITVNPATLPTGVVGSKYAVVFTATGGTAPYTFGESGLLPTGMLFSAAPTPGLASLNVMQAGAFPLSIIATDATKVCSGSRTYTLTISNAGTVNLVTTATLTFDSTHNQWDADVTFTNKGTAGADNVTLSNVALNSVKTITMLPISVGNIAPGATSTYVLVTFPASAATSGTTAVLSASGSYKNHVTGVSGNFSGSLRLLVP